METTNTDDDEEDDENDETTAKRKVDNKAPELLRATANEFEIVLIYHEEIDKNPSGDPAARDYTVITGRADGESGKISTIIRGRSGSTTTRSR